MSMVCLTFSEFFLLEPKKERRERGEGAELSHRPTSSSHWSCQPPPRP